jgi:hypothetical protein
MRIDHSNSRNSLLLITIFTLITTNQMFAGTRANINLLAAPITVRPIVSTAAKPTETATPLNTVALAGDPAPAEIGGTYARIESSSIDDSGDVAFSAQLAGGAADSALLMASGGETRVLLRAGDAAPDGGTFRSFEEIDVARLVWMGKEALAVFFKANLDGTVPSGLFIWTPESVETVALVGGRSKRGQTFSSFDQITISAATRDEGPFLVLAFVAGLAGGGKALIFRDPLLAQEQNLSTGDIFPLKLSVSGKFDDRIDDITISRLGAFMVGCALDVHRVRKPNKQYRRLIAFGSGALWVGNWLEGARIRNAGEIKRIFNPPSISFQSVLALVELTHKRKAITGFGSTLLETKQRAPGLPGREIRDLGAPVINSNYPFLGTTGVVAKTVLDGDSEALWIFDGGDFHRDSSERMELLDGAGGGESLRNFQPVKLSNDGSLLLTGNRVVDSAERAGVFVLKGVFPPRRIDP